MSGAGSTAVLNDILRSDRLFQKFPYSVLLKIDAVENLVIDNSVHDDRMRADLHIEVSGADLKLLVDGKSGFAELFRSGRIVASGNSRAMLLFSLFLHAALGRYLRSHSN